MIDRERDIIVILHGIGMPKYRMSWVDFCLKRAGFKTLNIAYPSLRRNIESCADYVAEKIEQKTLANVHKIHFVAHSLGTLVTLRLLSTGRIAKAGRAVLIAPPYRGSEVADFLHNAPFFNFLFGPAGAQLTTPYRRDVSYSLPDNIEVGVIAGTRPYEYPFFLGVMKKTGVHDGLVSLESTRIPGIKDHITIRMSHSFLLEKSTSETVHFLTHGRFSEKASRDF